MSAIIQNDEAELGLIGCAIEGGLECAVEIVEAVSPSAIYREDCRNAFAVIEAMATQGREINTATFVQGWREMHKVPMPEQILMSGLNVSPAQTGFFISVIADTDKRRRLAQAGSLLASKASDTTKATDALLSEAETILYSESVKSFPVLDSKTVGKDLISDLQDRFDNKGKLSGVGTGFRYLDRLTNGLQFGEQAIIAARPSVGKTAIALNTTIEAAIKNKIPTLFMTLEMRPAALLRRMLASYSSVSMGELRSGEFTEVAFAKFMEFQKVLNASPLYVVNCISGIDINRFSAVVRRAHRQHGIKLVVTDYLQKIKPSSKSEKRTYEVAQVSEALKAMADSTKTAFLTLAQLNRESEKDKGRPPRLSDLADSAQIERDGDMIGLLDRKRTKEDPQGENATLYIAKQRDGEVDAVHLKFNGQFCRFENPKP